MLTLQVEEKLSKTINVSGRHPAVPIFARGSVEARIILAFYPANEIMFMLCIVSGLLISSNLFPMFQMK
jgi:hypothetical protein